MSKNSRLMIFELVKKFVDNLTIKWRKTIFTLPL